MRVITTPMFTPGGADMRMIEIDFEAQPPIDGYGPNGFRIAGAWHEGGVLLLPDGITQLAAIDLAALERVLRGAAALDVLLIGQGADIAPLSADLRQALDDAGVGHEVMSSPSACRTYNVLLTEDRRVGAALLPVGVP
ncbi:MAG: Mth938-like domain-containing protein [Pseudomonadota bacterium]